MKRYEQAPRHFALCVASWAIYRACPWPERWRDVLYERRNW